MNSRVCTIPELPDDLQVLICDFVETSLGYQGLKRVESFSFTIHRLPLAVFPRVKMWTDYRNRAYSQAMIGQRLPPVLICGDQWLDGRNPVCAARRSGRTTVEC